MDSKDEMFAVRLQDKQLPLRCALEKKIAQFSLKTGVDMKFRLFDGGDLRVRIVGHDNDRHQLRDADANVLGRNRKAETVVT